MGAGNSKRSRRRHGRAQQRERLHFILQVFGRGCTNAGMMLDPGVINQLVTKAETGASLDHFYDDHAMNPASCVACRNLAVDQIMKALR